MAKNPFYPIVSVNISDWSVSNAPYSQYDVVYAPSGPAAGQCLISTYDGNVESGVPASLDGGAGLGAWENFQNEDFDFSDVWTPSYNASTTHEPNVSYIQFGDGYTQRQANGTNHQRFVFDVSFEDVSNAEAKSVLSFFEYKGGVGKFKVTIPEPFGVQKLFIAKDWSHQFAGYDRNTITAKFIEVFDKSFNEEFTLS